MGKTLPKNILLVIKNTGPVHRVEETPGAFVVDPSDSKIYDKAVGWAQFNQEVDFGTLEKVEPIEFYSKNEGFKVSLLEDAGASSQGGKLSFWNCLVEKDGTQAKVGIDTSILLSAMKQSTLINGVFQDTFSLYKANTAGIVNKNMKEWDMFDRDGKKARKTSKYKPGGVYDNITASYLYLGEVMCYFDSIGVCENRRNLFEVKLLQEPVKRHLLYIMPRQSTIRMDISSKDIKTFDDWLDMVLERCNDSRVKTAYQLAIASGIFSDDGSIVDKLTAREETGLYLHDGKLTLEDSKRKFFEAVRDRVIKALTKEKNISYSQCAILAKTQFTLTESEKVDMSPDRLSYLSSLVDDQIIFKIQ